MSDFHNRIAVNDGVAGGDEYVSERKVRRGQAKQSLSNLSHFTLSHGMFTTRVQSVNFSWISIR